MSIELTADPIEQEPAEKWDSYIFMYNYDNRQWAFNIMATSFEDAEARLYSIRYATLMGMQVCTYPAALGWYVRAKTKLKNFFKSLPKNND